MQIQPYLFFDGRCEEAIAFYKKALGAEVEMLVHWRDSPDQSMTTPANENKVMHSTFRIGETTLMASDGNSEKPEFKGFSLSISAPDETEAKKLFGALSEGGHVQMPLMKTFFSPCFGTLRDKFGVTWMIIVPM
jgi:PhnB protein